MRTRVVFDGDVMLIRPQTVCKSRVCDIDVRASCYDIRVSLQNECAVPDERVPRAVATTHVRIKQRRRFSCPASPFWRFDFCMSWSGATISEAEQKQQHVDPLFELECELVDPQAALCAKTDEQIAASLLLKMLDFLPSHTKMEVANVRKYGHP